VPLCRIPGGGRKRDVVTTAICRGLLDWPPSVMGSEREKRKMGGPLLWGALAFSQDAEGAAMGGQSPKVWLIRPHLHR
jgi:hypothetical protein